MTTQRTRSPRVWAQYLCWNVQFWMMTHQPYLPVRIRRFILDRFDPRRHYVSRRQYVFWLEGGHGQNRLPKPLPRLIGSGARGPFIGPWMRFQRFFRDHTGGRSHRCEFTDPNMGALYGHQEGPFMNAYFDEFLTNIEDSDD